MSFASTRAAPAITYQAPEPVKYEAPATVTVPETTPTPTPPATSVEDARVDDARRKAIVEQKKKKGRQSTILTSGQGVLDTAPTEKKTLLGE